ncbi:lysine N(6)-hydroxylase/L-ornithine N(5)-oxygenase family protein [Nocardioides okcheonensis]|uniref:lysine N(6)-hydroxylase/L-ornithine N(5)-oxygenase family protein n=1 Tax=Nocardioides okcheonensis TaxID=2894081 RepID=UPI001E3E3E7B|nr:SidA/IucD/PvdA family monooxygenase [Nocardioides okcheonensis]UFN42744.1 SidA/IucD/PvdA family monooxygenase [Nocardioides okcheonensis]
MTHVHDLLGIGLGPFNLGLACLADPLDDLDAVFLDGADGFSWHPGMLLPDATMQVPFLADLVTLADPTSRFSYLAFLKDVGRIYPFYVRESFYPLRREYDDYCRWAADRLGSVRWGEQVVAVEHDGESYVVRSATGRTWRARHLVLGTGTAPRLPFEVEGPALHSADYLARRDDLLASRSITVVGSGQSAAEVYADLLAEQERHGFELGWVTRSPRFFPLEYTKLTLEMTSPEWSAYFQALPAPRRAEVQSGQAALSKGISAGTVDAIFDELYRRSATGGVDTTLLTATEVTAARWDGSAYTLDLRHTEQDTTGRLRTESLVLATGYAPRVPDFLDPVRDRLRWDDRGRLLAGATFAVDHADAEVFVQNAEEHTHGFVAPDLGMGAMRSSVILAQVLGREPYPVEKRIAFQEWGIPDRLRHPVAR